MKYTKYTLLILFAFIGCDNPPKETIYKAEEVVSVKKSEAVSVNLSQIFDHISFIPLKNNKGGAESLDKIIFSEKYIYVLDKQITKGVFIYSTTGDFIRRVGNIGRGPGEYRSISGFDFHDNNIIISEYPDEILFFDENGKFIEKKKTNFEFSSFIAIDKGYLFFNDYRGTAGNNESLFNVIQTDKDLDFMRGYFPFKKELLRSNIVNYISNFTRTSNGEILFSQPFTNTVYAYEGDTLAAKTLFDFEDRPLPKDLTSKRIKREELMNIFQEGYSRLIEPFYSTSSNSFYRVLIEGAVCFVIQTPTQQRIVVKDYTDDFYGIPLYNFNGIVDDRLIGSVNWASIVMTLDNPTSNYNVKEPKLKSTLTEFLDKNKLDAEMAPPTIAMFHFK